MSSELWILLAALVLTLLVSATLAAALGLPSRVRISERLTLSGREDLLDVLLKTHRELAMCIAMVRTGCSLALVLVLYRAFAASSAEQGYATYLPAFATSLLLVLVFGVAIPSAWAKYAGEALLVGFLPALLLLHKAFFPLVWSLRLLDTFVRRLAGVPAEDADDEAARHERELLDALSESEKLGAVDEEEKEMIESVMELGDSSVAEIMTPRTEIEAVPKEISLAEIKAMVRKVGHSRIPVYDGTIDEIIGVIYAKDLLVFDGDDTFDAKSAMRSPTFIPETKNVRDLLHEFQNKKVHMAIVLDEYGGTAGLATMEDILEELVGEIVDEYDTDEPEPMTRIDQDTIDVDARVRVEELNEELDVELPEDEDYETIAGFVCSSLGRIPTVGEQVDHVNVQIRVIEADPRRISRLRVHVDRNSNPPNDRP